MRIIPKRYLDLESGLVRARELDRHLQAEWKPQRVRQSRAANPARAETFKRYGTTLDAQAQMRQDARLKHWTGYALLALGLFVTCPGLFCYWSFNLQARKDNLFLILLGALILVIIGLLAAGTRETIRADQLAAQAEALKRAEVSESGEVGIARPGGRARSAPLADLPGLWWKKIEADARLEAANTKDGDTGEILLLEALQRALPNTYFAARGLRIVENLDADIVLFGPTGIWVLESKYWSGEVSFANDHWTRHKEFYGPGGVLQHKEDSAADFHRQWRRECDIIFKILRTALPHWRLKIEGGLVFTHPEVVLHIDKSCPVNVGTISGWVKRIKATPNDPAMTETDLLRALDVLLTVAHSYDGGASKSSVRLAEQLYRQQEAQLKAAVQA